MSGFGAAGAAESVARLEVSCVIRATDAGQYQLGVSGLGHFRLLVDGAEILDATLSRPEGADVVEALMAPPQQLVVVGTTAEVESEGFDRTSLALPGRQDELVRRVELA